MNNRIFVIGDIHGMYDKFLSLMSKINKEKDKDDLLIFIGDYIDRGPDSYKVVEYIRHLKNKICLMGNHEEMLITSVYYNTDPYVWRINGGGKTIKSYRAVYPNIEDFTDIMNKSGHGKFFKSLKYFYETDKFFFVHAGISPLKGLKWSKKDKPTLTWVRDEFLNSDKNYGKIIIHGHTINTHGPEFKGNRIGIDTGSFLSDGKISCVVLPECKVIQSD